LSIESSKNRGILLWKNKWNCEKTPAVWPTRARPWTRTVIIVTTRLSVTVFQKPDATTIWTASEHWIATM